MENSKVYIVLSRSSTVFARIIRFYTRKRYNHASLCFDERLDTAYSFGRRYPRLWFPGGFVEEGREKGFFALHPEIEILVLELEVTNAQLASIRAKLAPMQARPRAYKYQLSSVYYTMRHRPCDRTDKFVCSGFVAYALQGILPVREHYSQVLPCDFLKLGLKPVYQGSLADFKEQVRQHESLRVQ